MTTMMTTMRTFKGPIWTRDEDVDKMVAIMNTIMHFFERLVISTRKKRIFVDFEDDDDDDDNESNSQHEDIEKIDLQT